MSAGGFCLFETQIGHCGIAWHEQAITRVWLPEADVETTRTRLRQLLSNADEVSPPEFVCRVIDDIVGLLSGCRVDLSEVPLDMAGVSPFQRKVLEEVRGIPAGQTLTYGAVAAAVGAPGSARAVGRALGSNPFPIVVPCHRVVAANNRSGGFSATGGIRLKMRMLNIERAEIH